jgi:hypothetical protein
MRRHNSWFIVRIDSATDSVPRYATEDGVEIFDPYRREPNVLRFRSKDEGEKIALRFRDGGQQAVVEPASSSLAILFDQIDRRPRIER